MCTSIEKRVTVFYFLSSLTLSIAACVDARADITPIISAMSRARFLTARETCPALHHWNMEAAHHPLGTAFHDMAPRGKENSLSDVYTSYVPQEQLFRQYPTNRDGALKNSRFWLDGKRIDDNIGPFWRIHNKLYDLTDFIPMHPGGPEWLELTKGTDITEAFESAHTGSYPESLLKKYFVKDIFTPRNSPYTFKDDGFYRTLKRKVQPILAKVGRGPTLQMKLFQDTLAAVFCILMVSASWCNSTVLAGLAGIVLAMMIIMAHNFFHQRNNFRMYYFDFSLLSSLEWRISHALSHHLFTNTIYDYEVSALEPFIEFLPTKHKTFMQRYGCLVYHQILYFTSFFIGAVNKVWLILTGRIRLHPENCIPIVEFCIMAVISSPTSAICLWITMHSICNYWFAFVGLIAAHHHPDIYHEGDRQRENPDWGLCQVDAVRDRVEITGSLFLVTTTFGDHTLHHLFPTVDHSKLPHLYPAFLETCREFGVQFKFLHQHELIWGKYAQMISQTPNPHPPGFKITPQKKEM